jgi:plasmid stabilization system protein ParE
MRIVVRPVARRDIILQVGYYLDELAFEAAERFSAAVEIAMQQIGEQPGIGSLRFFDSPKLQGLRCRPVPGFEDIRIYYLHPQPGLIRIIRVLHGKRDLAAIFGVPE